MTPAYPVQTRLVLAGHPCEVTQDDGTYAALHFALNGAAVRPEWRDAVAHAADVCFGGTSMWTGGDPPGINLLVRRQPATTPTPASLRVSKQFGYDVALSFAGEDRSKAERIAAVCKARGITVFYDEDEKAVLWGKDLYQHLAEVYENRARFCIVFVSVHYAAKLWTNHEFRAAQARAFRENEYILPVRLDDTKLPGLHKTVGYIDWTQNTPEGIVGMLTTKLFATESAMAQPPPPGTATAVPDLPREALAVLLAFFERRNPSGFVFADSFQDAVVKEMKATHYQIGLEQALSRRLLKRESRGIYTVIELGEAGLRLVEDRPEVLMGGR